MLLHPSTSVLHGCVRPTCRLDDQDSLQDFIVKDVRQTLFDCISSFEGGLENECDMERLIESQIKALQEPLKISPESSAHRHNTVATKLLKLYRTGRLGRYTLDLVAS